MDQIQTLLKTRPNTRLADIRVACFGLSYKPDVPDLTNSPALQIVQQLAAQGVTLDLVDPHVTSLPSGMLSANIPLSQPDQALAHADICVFLVNHRAFHDIPARLPPDQMTIDVCGVLHDAALRQTSQNLPAKADGLVHTP